jgi:hypothetical protein
MNTVGYLNHRPHTENIPLGAPGAQHYTQLLPACTDLQHSNCALDRPFRDYASDVSPVRLHSLTLRD